MKTLRILLSVSAFAVYLLFTLANEPTEIRGGNAYYKNQTGGYIAVSVREPQFLVINSKVFHWNDSMGKQDSMNVHFYAIRQEDYSPASDYSFGRQSCATYSDFTRISNRQLRDSLEKALHSKSCIMEDRDNSGATCLTFTVPPDSIFPVEGFTWYGKEDAFVNQTFYIIRYRTNSGKDTAIYSLGNRMNLPHALFPVTDSRGNVYPQ